MEDTFSSFRFSTLTVRSFLSRTLRKEIGQSICSVGHVFYLIMPDRFANGDISNDTTANTLEGTDRNNSNGRHGGDIAGMISKLDYLQTLGVTTIWPTPLWESNHVKNTYHGYACTDFYNIDPRYGNNLLYKQFADECHKRGLKLVMDVVPNHCSRSQ